MNFSFFVTDPTVKPTNITGGTMAFLALLAAPSFVLSSYVVVYLFFFYCIVDVWKSFIRHLHIPFIVLTLFQRYLSLLAEIELLPIY